MRDAFRVAINIESNRRASGKYGRREEPTLLKNPRNKTEKVSTAKPKDDEKWEKVYSTLKDIKQIVAKKEKGIGNERKSYNRNDR